MTNPRPLAILAAITVLCLCVSACGTNRTSAVMHRGPVITVLFEHSDTYYGTYHYKDNTIRLSSVSPRATLAHEMCHAADHFGSFQLAMECLGACDVPGYDICLDILERTKHDKRPLAHWKALQDLCGTFAVNHREIIDQLKRL